MKAKCLCFLVFFFFLSSSIQATEPIDSSDVNRFFYGGIGTVNFSHTGYGQYYSAGGLGTVNINSFIDLYTSTLSKDNSQSVWDNNLRLDYGVVKIDNTNDEQFTKAADDLDFISKFGCPIGKSDDLYYSSAFNLQTQLTNTRTAYNEELNEFSPLIGEREGEFGTVQSGFLAPADISLGVGVEYKPNEQLSVFTGALTGKVRVVNDEQIAQSGLYGNEVIYDEVTNEIISYESARVEAGANIIANYHNKFLEKDRLAFSTNVKLFSNYLSEPENIDVNWNTITSLNPWQFITINYTTNLAYDDNKQFTAYSNGEEIEGGAVQGIQFKNMLGIGLTYKLNDGFEKKKIEAKRLLYVKNEK